MDTSKMICGILTKKDQTKRQERQVSALSATLFYQNYF
jgi:hypothetical protein